MRAGIDKCRIPGVAVFIADEGTMMGYDAHCGRGVAHGQQQQQREGAEDYAGSVYYWHDAQHMIVSGPSSSHQRHDWVSDQYRDAQESEHVFFAGSAQQRSSSEADMYARSYAYQEELQRCFGWEAPTPQLLDLLTHVVMGCWEAAPAYEQFDDLREFMAYIVSEMDVCAWALYTATAYMFRLKLKFEENAIQTQNCSAQLFAVCLMTATKFLYDIPFSNAQWATTTQLDHKHLNMMELELLDALEYNLSVDEEELQGIGQHLDAYAVSSVLATMSSLPQQVDPVAPPMLHHDVALAHGAHAHAHHHVAHTAGIPYVECVPSSAGSSADVTPVKMGVACDSWGCSGGDMSVACGPTVAAGPYGVPYTPLMQPSSSLSCGSASSHNHRLVTSASYLVPELHDDALVVTGAGYGDATSMPTVTSSATTAPGADPFSLFHFGPLSPTEVVTSTSVASVHCYPAADYVSDSGIGGRNRTDAVGYMRDYRHQYQHPRSGGYNGGTVSTSASGAASRMTRASMMIPKPMYAPAHCLPHPAWAAQPTPFSFFSHAAY